jgi:hypothetical protein
MTSASSHAREPQYGHSQLVCLSQQDAHALLVQQHGPSSGFREPVQPASTDCCYAQTRFQVLAVSKWIHRITGVCEGVDIAISTTVISKTLKQRWKYRLFFIFQSRTITSSMGVVKHFLELDN